MKSGGGGFKAKISVLNQGSILKESEYLFVHRHTPEESRKDPTFLKSNKMSQNKLNEESNLAAPFWNPRTTAEI